MITMNLPTATGRRALDGLIFASAVLLVAACGATGAPSPGGGATSGTPGTRPSSSPASSPAASPRASTPVPVPAGCATSALRLGTGYQQGAAGTAFYDITFTNISGSACVLQGYPGVSLVSAGSDAGSQIGADAKRDAAAPVTPVTLPAGQTAHAVLGVTQAANYPAGRCQPVTAHWLKVFPPNQYTAAYLPFNVRTCASTSVATLHITPVSAGR
jgi:hypothetical protein